MAYTRTALGIDLPAPITEALGKLGPVVGSATKVLQDPYLPEAACRVGQLYAIENKKPIPSCPTTPKGRVGGIGLRKVIVPLRGYVYAERHPVVKPLAVAAVIGIPALIGYFLGKKKG